MSRYPCAVLVVAIALARVAGAEAPDPDPGRFSEAIEVFASWDSKNAFPREGILFVGSSSLRLWPTAQAFPGKPVINRGFGGSELSDVIYFYAVLIKQYSPDRILLYAGDNDIANGKSAEQVFEDYLELVALLRADLPAAELIFISIKPSKARWEQWPEMVEANRRVKEYAMNHDGLDYADLASPLLDDNGMLRDVFAEDDLHLNADGYRLWQEALAPFLD